MYVQQTNIRSDCSGLLEVNPRWRFTIRAFTNNFCFIVYVNIWFKNMGVSYTSQKKTKTMIFIQIPPRVINSHHQARILYYQPRQELDNLRHLPKCLSWTVVLYENTFLKPRGGRKYTNIQIQIQLHKHKHKYTNTNTHRSVIDVRTPLTAASASRDVAQQRQWLHSFWFTSTWWARWSQDTF